MTATTIPHEVQANFRDDEPQTDDFLEQALHGLQQNPPTLPSKFFYDRRGSELFDRICELPEYYPTRTEISILQKHIPDIARTIGPKVQLVEPGSGSAVKIRLLLDHLQQVVSYVPLEISRSHLLASAKDIAQAYPGLKVLPICADYMQPVQLPPLDEARRRVLFFPGSTLGNLPGQLATQLLERMARMAGEDGGLLIGIDLRKSLDVLIPAYNDSQGITAAFNLNMLHRLHNELGSDVNPEQFHHEAIWNDDASRIEMHLVSNRNQSFTLGGRQFTFAEGDRIVTEYSHKYTLDAFEMLAPDWQLKQVWQDDRHWFAVMWLTVKS